MQSITDLDTGNIWEVFRDLDEIRDGLPVNVYIYTSHSTSPIGLAASWHAWYVGHVKSIGGGIPSGFNYGIGAGKGAAGFRVSTCLMIR